jgi:lysyl-tRNA synthetase class 2
MAEQRLEEIRKIRLEKVEKLREMGINPYPSQVKGVYEPISVVRDSLDQAKAVVGRVMSWRTHGNVIFADLKDESGKIQLLFQKKNLGDNFKTLKLFDIGDFLWATGKVVKTQAGEITLDTTDFQLLTKSIRPLPSVWHGLKDTEERYRQRYVDLLMNPDVKKVFLTRTKILTNLRNFLDNNGFVEVETPVLQPIYGGASARPFITHQEVLDIDLYLRISDELYLKRLIVGGFEKVYEVSKDFRNEGVDKQHNPEFTQIEFYWAYADYNDLMEFTERMLAEVIEKSIGSLEIQYEDTKLNFKPPIKRVTYRDLLLEHTGIDLNNVKDEKALLDEIKSQNLNLDLKGVIGYGALVDALYKNYARPKVVQPTFLIDHPYELMPLAKRKTDDSSRIESVQLLVHGFELIKAYSELNDPKDQKERWQEHEGLAKKGLEEHEAVDEDYIRALEYGMPPTAGWGMGIDRLTAILTNQHSLKEVILFPTLRPEK